jgi:hypothetical protein
MQCEKKKRLRMHVGIVHGTFIMRTRAIGKGGEDSEMARDYCAPVVCTSSTKKSIALFLECGY